MTKTKSRLTVIKSNENHPTDSDTEESGVSESNSVLKKNIDKFDKVLVIGFTTGGDENEVSLQHTQNMSLMEVNWLETIIKRYIESELLRVALEHKS